MSFSPIGDTVAVVKLAYSLYNRVVVVARDAPEQFEELKTELQATKDVLYRVTPNRDSACSAPVRNILISCFDTLRGLRDLTAKYENLTWSDRSVLIKRFKFVSEQGAIDKFREKLREQQRRLQLALTVDGRNQLAEIAQQESTAHLLKGPEKPTVKCSHGYNDGHNSLIRAQTAATTDSARTLTSNRNCGPTLSPTVTGPECQCKQKRVPKGGNPTNKETIHPLTIDTRSLSISTTGSTCSGCDGSFGKAGASGVDTDTSIDSYFPDHSTLPRPKTSLQPFYPSPDREKHNAGPEVTAAFERSHECLKDEFDVESWARLATWWLIKSRIVRRLISQTGLQRRETDSSQYQDGWERSISEEQAWADLLKASWILEDIVLAEGNEETISAVFVRRIIKDLITNLNKDFRECRESRSRLAGLEDGVILKQDLPLLESFEQEIEAKENVPIAIDDPSSPHRWFNTDQDNAGIDGERVIFRTFVNAQLGRREDRSKSSSAPYMLLEWTRAGDSELLISICNQRGTVNLSRNLLAEDFEKYHDADATTPFRIEFPSQEAEVMFLNTQDVSDFLRQPRLYFAAMKEKAPRPGELAIYQAPISTYAFTSLQLLPNSPPSMSMASGQTSSCGLRIYESMTDNCWKTTRRLVLSSAPDSLDPECATHWIPLDHVRIFVDRNKATVSWSDCGRLETISDKNYGVHHSFVYKAEEPNRKIHLEFQSQSEAQRFRNSLLLPTEISPQVTARFESCLAFQSIRIYRLFDADEPDHHAYHAITSTKQSPQGPHMTKIYYAYKDLDWLFVEKKGSPTTIEFPSLFVPQYTSTLPRLQAKPKATDAPPEFSDVEEDEKNAMLDFVCDHDLFQFMHALTGWKPKFVRAVERVTLVDTSPLFRCPKDTFKDVHVQLWEKTSGEGRSCTHFAVRLNGEVKNRWITAPLSGNDNAKKYTTIEIDRLSIYRGVGIDTKEMTAKKRTAEEQPTKHNKWKLLVTFRNPQDQGEFLRCSGLDSYDREGMIL